MRFYSSLVELIGNTPLVKLQKIPPGKAHIYVKLEYMNPTGSHKDRIALYMIREAERKGLLKQGGTIVEASSGNTAISVAWLASQLGYNAIIVVEEGISPAKVSIIKALGAKVVFAPRVPLDHPEHSVKVAKRLAAEWGCVFLNQFENEANVKAHYETTAAELYSQLGGEPDAFVMGIGTAGTIAGVAQFFREKGMRTKIVGVVPKGSPIVTGCPTLGEPIEGLATSTVSFIYEKYSGLIDLLVEVDYRKAYETMLRLAKEEGVLGGLSTGANVVGALKVAEETGSKVIATLAPDSMFRYAHLLID
ncbi:MAG: cysteine synthase family protein [Thermofilaceae archaeon]